MVNCANCNKELVARDEHYSNDGTVRCPGCKLQDVFTFLETWGDQIPPEFLDDLSSSVYGGMLNPMREALLAVRQADFELAQDVLENALEMLESIDRPI